MDLRCTLQSKYWVWHYLGRERKHWEIPGNHPSGYVHSRWKNPHTSEKVYCSGRHTDCDLQDCFCQRKCKSVSWQTATYLKWSLWYVLSAVYVPGECHSDRVWGQWTGGRDLHGTPDSWWRRNYFCISASELEKVCRSYTSYIWKRKCLVYRMYVWRTLPAADVDKDSDSVWYKCCSAGEIPGDRAWGNQCKGRKDSFLSELFLGRAKSWSSGWFWSDTWKCW